MFLREVDDALREDQLFHALRRYGKPVGALVVAGLVGLAGWLWYDYHKATVAGENAFATGSSAVVGAGAGKSAGAATAAARRAAGITGGPPR